MQITVDVSRCIGAGQCVLSAPEVFDQDEKGIVRVLVPRPSEEFEDAVFQADLHCPSGTITIDQD
jgi:ferredoxin